MNFVSSTFVIFLLLVWAIFFFLPPKHRASFLTVASYLFYATWSVPFIAVILLTTSIDYISSKVIYNSTSPGTRKKAFTLAIILNLVILGFFKYFNFFLASEDSLLSWFGIHNPLPKHLEIILPLGISFYTFEAISYVVDVYRGSKPAKNFWEYNFYIMFFPHLISGPIIRFGELWMQYREPIQLPRPERFLKGLELVFLGYIFKVMVADNCGLAADPLFNNPKDAGYITSYLGTVAFTAQIYFDFLGYTHIARGIALLFNIELPVNFNHPFAAANMSNFWERWHISLSRWIKDYLYIPLGGSRLGVPRTMFNLFLVMTIAGAWHGAGWTYVIWGLYHGLVLASYHLYKTVRPRVLGSLDKLVLGNRVYRCLSSFLVFSAVAIGCVVFRSPDLVAASVIFKHLTRFGALFKEVQMNVAQGQLSDLGTLAVLLFVCLSGPLITRMYESLYKPMPSLLKVQSATAVIVLCWIAHAKGSQPFIYFQF